MCLAWELFGDKDTGKERCIHEYSNKKDVHISCLQSNMYISCTIFVKTKMHVTNPGGRLISKC